MREERSFIEGLIEQRAEGDPAQPANKQLDAAMIERRAEGDLVQPANEQLETAMKESAAKQEGELQQHAHVQANVYMYMQYAI